MNTLSFKACLLALTVSGSAFAAEAASAAPVRNEPASAAAKLVTEEMIRARLAEHVKTKAAAKPTTTTTTTTTPPAPAAPSPAAVPPAYSGATAPTPDLNPHPATPAEKEMAEVKTDPATVLPKVEVRRTRTTEIEKEVFQQERDIAREKLKTKSNDVDRALNGTGKSKALSIFGGETTKQRETVASERVSLMESERDIMEAIAYAKTKEEKEALRKELTELKALRRDLEAALR